MTGSGKGPTQNEERRLSPGGGRRSCCAFRWRLVSLPPQGECAGRPQDRIHVNSISPCLAPGSREAAACSEPRFLEGAARSWPGALPAGGQATGQWSIGLPALSRPAIWEEELPPGPGGVTAGGNPATRRAPGVVDSQPTRCDLTFPSLTTAVTAGSKMVQTLEHLGVTGPPSRPRRRCPDPDVPHVWNISMSRRVAPRGLTGPMVKRPALQGVWARDRGHHSIHVHLRVHGADWLRCACRDGERRSTRPRPMGVGSALSARSTRRPGRWPAR
jgi:hypothetical protein